MKVCHITTVHPKNDNRIFYKECVTLKEAGYDVSFLIAGEENHRKNGVNIIGLKKHKSRLSNFLLTSFMGVLKSEKKIKADLYHFHDPELIFTGLFLKLKGKKVIYDIHENNSAAIMSKPYIKSRIVKWIISKCFDLLEKNAIRFFDGIITARPDITEKFKHKNIVTLRNFPILDFNSQSKEYIEPSKDTKKSVIFVGGMSHIRGIDTLIDAFNEMPEYDLKLLGPIKQLKLKEKVETSNENIKYLGTVEPYEIFNHIYESTAGIITFLPAPNHVKTLATKPFEYMACGRPMIMSNFPYWKNFFQDSSLYTDPENKDEIIKVCRELLENDTLSEEMGRTNLKLAITEYNWKEESKRMIKLYSKILG